jgi:hypothetical protein
MTPRVWCLPVHVRRFAVLAAAGVLAAAAMSPVAAAETVLIQAGSAMTYRANGTPERVVLIEFGSEMRYLANAADPGLGLSWTAPDFDDASWPEGSYGVGYETQAGGAQNLLQTSVPAGTRSVFTRARFALDDPGAVTGLFLGVDYDDGFVAWVNGVEVARSSSMPADPAPAWNAAPTSRESSNGAIPNYGTLRDLTVAALPHLVAGDNVLAIGVWNVSATSTDLVLVPQLSMGPDWTRPDFDDGGWSAGVYGVGYEIGTTPPLATALLATTVPPGSFSVFTRATFEVADAASVGSLFFGADYDDGVVAWLNGVEVFGSTEMPLGALTFSTDALLHESSNGVTPNYGPMRDISLRALPALVDGANVLAVGVWNSNAAQSTDLVLVPRLAIGEADPCDGADNDGDGQVDEGYPNFDGDAFKDCVDPDDDNDGIADAADCHPLDPTAAAAPPAEIQAHVWQRALVRRNIQTWMTQGAGVSYDAVTGLISSLRTDMGVGGAACLSDGVPVADLDDVRPLPPPGDGYYYLIRAEKAGCGQGSYGVATTGDERLPLAACM